MAPVSATDTVPRWGVNYVPSKRWWYCWIDWNLEDVAADLDAIALLGVDHVRIHCLWPLFQPNPRYVSESMLQRLTDLLDLADERDLDVIVTVLNGWLSGFDFRPSWLAHETNMFVDADAVSAQKYLISQLAERIGEHPRFLGFDVANEPSTLAEFPMNVVGAGGGDRWLHEMSRHCAEVAPGRLHSVGMDHRPWLTDGSFSRTAMAETADVTPVHAWPYFTGALARYGQDGTGNAHLSEYMLELAKAYHRSPSRSVWLQEVGIAPEWAAGNQLVSYVRNATAAAMDVTNLWGITWWCSHDVDRDLAGFLNLEYDLGLLTTDNTLKPAGEAFKDAVSAAKLVAGPTSRTTALVLPTGIVPDLDFADSFFDLIDQGVRPAIVLGQYSADSTHLADRGLTNLIWPQGHATLNHLENTK
jgi:endo-1,4-beta-mannosidase